MAGTSPGRPGRGDTPAIYQRRRLLAGAVVLVLLVVIGLAFWDGEDANVADAPRDPDEVLARQREEKPVRFTVSVSGDLLIHSPVFERALAIGGGRRYDFTPMFGQVRPYVKGVDLAFCHVETSMGPGPPAGLPDLQHAARAGQAIARTGWEACSTASNHAIDHGAGRDRRDHRGARPRWGQAHGHLRIKEGEPQAPDPGGQGSPGGDTSPTRPTRTASRCPIRGRSTSPRAPSRSSPRPAGHGRRAPTR